MENYMLMLRADEIDFSSYSPADYQRILEDFDKWNAAMISENRLIASANLKTGQGRTLKGTTVKNGPYSEAIEVITGIFLIRASDYEDAVKIASGCPFLSRGGSVEVRLVPTLEFENVALEMVERDIKNRAQKAAVDGAK
ncbi:MAG: hypothetical protein JNM27_02815 [Leptospirales bacterium]|nr:hypothetical protein [Leptospirales bacterium]